MRKPNRKRLGFLVFTTLKLENLLNKSKSMIIKYQN